MDRWLSVWAGACVINGVWAFTLQTGAGRAIGVIGVAVSLAIALLIKLKRADADVRRADPRLLLLFLLPIVSF